MLSTESVARSVRSEESACTALAHVFPFTMIKGRKLPRWAFRVGDLRNQERCQYDSYETNYTFHHVTVEIIYSTTLRYGGMYIEEIKIVVN